MGNVTEKVVNKMKSSTAVERRILMIGLDNAGLCADAYV